MKYQRLNENAEAERRGADQSLLNDGLTLQIAEGETLDGRKWTAWLRAVGEIRGVLHDRNTGENIDIYNDNINSYFENNEQLEKAEESGDLELDNNNWYDLEFIVDGEYIEMDDQSVCFSINEGLALFDSLMESPDFIAYIDNEEAGIRKTLETLVDWCFNNLNIENESDIPHMFNYGSKEGVIFKKMIMEKM